MNLFFKRILQMIKQAYVSGVTDDSSAYPQVQVSYNGKATNAVRLSPYGLCTNPPNGANVLLLSSQAQESTKFALIDDMRNRFNNLEEGEVAVYHYDTESLIYFKNNGNIEIVANGNLLASVEGKTDLDSTGDVTVTTDGNAKIDASGNVDVDAGGTLTADAVTSATVTAPTITLNGNVTIAGTLSQTGGGASSFSGAIAATEMTAGGVSYTSHVHGGVTSGGDTSGGPQ
jgi:phage gp45-like